MHDITRDFLVSLVAFVVIGSLIYVFIITHHRERMSMLEKGIDPSAPKPKGTSYTLKIGMLSIGLALGILLGNVVYRATDFDETVAFSSMIFLMSGLGLVANFIIEQKLKP